MCECVCVCSIMVMQHLMVVSYMALKEKTLGTGQESEVIKGMDKYEVWRK